MNWFSFLLGKRSRPALAARRPQTRPAIEELESRLVPSTTSTNWSGYAVTTTPGAVTAVSGTWTVPAVTGSGATTYSSAWVGIDGYNSATVEQTGTEQDVVNGHAQYYAWYEMYPGASAVISSVAVHAGDTINASVTSSGGKFILTLTDVTDNQTFTTKQTLASAKLSSAEWIMEAPSSNKGVLPLANFGTASFTNASATINNVAGSINSNAAATVEQINMVNGHTGAIEDTTSSLDSTGTAFTVTFGAGTPTPPSTVATISTLTDSGVTTSRRVTYDNFVDTITPQSGSALPTGTVTVMYGNTVIGTVQIQDVNGVAEAAFTLDFYGAGVYDISVVYSGASGFQGSTSNTLAVTVG